MISNFSEFINESGPNEDPIYKVTQILSSAIQDECEDHYVNFSSFTRPLVNQIEVSLEYGEYNIRFTENNSDGRDADYVVHVTIKLKPTFDEYQVDLIANSDIGVLTDFGLLDFTTLVKSCKFWGVIELERKRWPTEPEWDLIEYPYEGEIGEWDLHNAFSQHGIERLDQLASFLLRNSVENAAWKTLYKNTFRINPV